MKKSKKKNQKKKEQKLKEIIVELKTEQYLNAIPKGNCPYAYYPMDKFKGDHINEPCMSIDCSVCKKKFGEIVKENVKEWVKTL